MAKKYGLPTFPIIDGMHLGDREPDEIEWLLEHGSIEKGQLKLIKTVDVYQLIGKNGTTAEAGDLQALLQEQEIVSWLHWYGHNEEE